MDIDHIYITKSPKETARVGQKLGDWVGIKGTSVICLYGELGSGKTTFAGGIAKAFGITTRLLSPTFIIVRRYQIPETSRFLFHIDLYRIEGEKDLVGLGLTEILADPDSVVVVEWAEKLTKNLPEKRIDVWFTVHENGNHHIQIRQTNI